MPKITAQFLVPEIDFNREKKRIDRRMRQAVRTSARRWIAAVVRRVPVWTGMSRAGLFAIAQLANANIAIGPLQAKSRIPEGRELGQAAIFDRSPIYEFEVRIQVPHYVIQEFRSTRPRGSPKAPFRSFDAGQRAFIRFAETVKLPAPRIKPRVIARF